MDGEIDMLRSGIIVLGVVIACGTATAREQGSGRDVAPVSSAAMGLDSAKRGIQGPAGLISARLLLHINASKNAFGKPVALAPDIFYSVSDTLQLGLLHNGPMGILTAASAHPGLCFSGTGGGCPKVYDNIGFDALYGIAFGEFNFSLHTSFFVLSFSDPTPLMLTLGGAFKFHFSDNVALLADPQFGIGLNKRDVNKDQLFLPLQLQFQVSRAATLDLLTGVTGPLSSLSDAYRVPLGMALVFNINPHVDLGFKFAFDNLLGKMPPGSERADARSLAILVNIRS
jgi:hypothetical protein